MEPEHPFHAVPYGGRPEPGQYGQKNENIRSSPRKRGPRAEISAVTVAFLDSRLRGNERKEYASNQTKWHLKILPDPGALHVGHPVADVPFAPGAEAAELVRPAINRHVHHRKPGMRLRRFQRGAQIIGIVAAG